MRLTVLLAVVGLAATAGRADAYPQFQLSTGAETCKECHFSPAGGGLINDYGRDEAGTTLAMKEGNGTFLNGLWTPPESFQIGGDFRVFVCCVKSSPAKGTEFVWFPMQAELYVRPKIGPVSLYVTGGILPTRQSYVSAFVSREHYAMYEKDNWYARIGRFYPIYGIRSQDHTAVIRRDLQMYIYEEPYTAAWGKYFTSSELHVSAFVKGFDSTIDYSVAHDNGVAAYYEKRNEEGTRAMAAQTKLTISDTDRRAWVGGVYKQWLEGPKVMLLGEADVGMQMFPAVSGLGTPAPLYELVGYAGATYMAKPGLMLGGTLQTFDPDLAHHGTSRDSADVTLQWMPVPHVEVHALGRVEVEALDFGAPEILGLIQLHYYL